jgi:hypothetical protein
MLFFRSEELVREWCAARGVAPGPCVRLDPLWGLAKAWYSTRMSPDARRPGPDEMREIFAGLGLTGSFWDQKADHFGGTPHA